MNNIYTLFTKNSTVSSFLEATKQEQFNYLLTGVTKNHNYLLTYATYLKSGSFVVYVANNVYQANLAYEAFCRVAGQDNVNLYVVDEFLALEVAAISNDFKVERLNTLKSIVNNEPKIIVTHTAALLKPLVNKTLWSNSIIKLNVNDLLIPQNFINNLVKMGYKRTATTAASGEFSVRGEIIDVFSSGYSQPVRINLFDVEIETLKYFDLTTQKTTSKIDYFEIYPLNEIILSKSPEEIIAAITKDCDEIPPFVANDIQDLEHYENIEKMFKYIKYITNDYYCFLEYLNNKIVFYDDYQKIEDSFKQLSCDLENYLESIKIPKKLDLFYFFDLPNIFYTVNKQIHTSEFKKTLPNIKLDHIFDFNGYPVVNYQNDISTLCADLAANPQKTYVIALESKEKIGLLYDIFRERSLVSHIIEDFSQCEKKRINLINTQSVLGYGFYNDIEVITDTEIFKTPTLKKTRYRSAIQNVVAINSKEDLEIGDFVVHYDYGIGRYVGLKTVELNGLRNDYLKLQYENMELFIPVEKIVLLEKYQGGEGSIPKLTKLGTNEWEKKKTAIREKLESIAKDLIEVQVKRETEKGFTYPPDNNFQTMFEEDFEYEETEDQTKIINQIKNDMESGVLIDRLVCGDVGFGKTEIAIRSAFKTVFGGKQVAYLAPTTILTRQHYYTFKNRLEKYGIKVALLSRLVTPKEQALVLGQLKTGAVDVVIGTHRLLSDDISFKDLGLLIIDEEQRFGVIHKEKIKRLKVNVNVLTLTATPIPRTLQMAIMGIRQLSLIETPPEDRYPIQTYVLEYNDAIIKEAIYRELSRGGQIFYLHNTISDLEHVYRRLKRLVPELKICIGHGKMAREDLEDTIEAFVNRDYDLLLCTTIIETGIDIPNTNTLIIDDADRLGLSQIYQIRGRVGRSDRIAYAYLTYKPNKVLTSQGAKRLSAIKEFTRLGSGYRIAVRDLAIRGAGDILGSEQSGFINSVGIDMYMKLLEEAVNKIKGIPEKQDVSYQIDVSKHVDESYVSDDAIKILIHKEISSIDSKETKLKIIGDFTDRFGKLNTEILLYIEEKYLESLLKKFNITHILEAKYLVTIIIPEKDSLTIKGDELFIIAYHISPDFTFEYRRHQIIIKINKLPDDKSWIYKLSGLLEKLTSTKKAPV
ncbi:MAG: transcription-repair coupling factor [Bacilli bacterium]